MIRYKVTGHVNGVGPIAHIIKAKGREAAKERFKRAYAKQGCDRLHVGKP